MSIKKDTTITIVGAGYVGLSTAALLANAGYRVFLVDINQERLKTIAQGRSFFYEEGIDELIKAAVTNKTLIPTDSYSESVPGSSVVFSCVGTPDNTDGSSNLSYVFEAAKQIAQEVSGQTVFVQKSTVPVGTGQKVQKIFAEKKAKVDYVSNPEFLREGTAISDALWFDRVVCGGSDKKAVETVFDLYKAIESQRDNIAKLANISAPKVIPEGSYVSTTLESAELIKVTANAFLAMKISFANSIAQLADNVGADVVEVMDAVGEDRRIGRAFLNAGRGYGGGCFPKDVSGLIASIHEHGANPELFDAVQDVNISMPGYIVTRLQSHLGGDLNGKKIAVLGLAFKAGTSDARRSPAIMMANTLAQSGAIVTAYDPEANEEAKPQLDKTIQLKPSANEAMENAEVVIVATDWPELKALKSTQLKNVLVVDAMNCLDVAALKQAGVQYLGVGRG